MMSNPIYGVCKRTIERGNYPADMEMRLNVFLAGALLTMEQWTELVGMLT